MKEFNHADFHPRSCQVAQIGVGGLAGLGISALGSRPGVGSHSEAVGELFVLVGLGGAALILALLVLDGVWLHLLPVR